ncbi:hypothetical protein MSG28_007983 [Choristoneura fumiferana]|uniref:Uncharacterized protein n=1 Tax=Choristoneura fumiferana TaxID=7141 RepID=A0ACC0J9G8_CHOFU|nr:hypothetical protein MSG28_007983 [Choristoneura fumiferana]
MNTQQACSDKEVFSSCYGHCEATCELPKQIVCTLACRQGCICKEGLVRRKDGKQIKSIEQIEGAILYRFCSGTEGIPIYVPLLGTGLLSEQEGLGHSSHAGPVRIGNFARTIESHDVILHRKARIA